MSTDKEKQLPTTEPRFKPPDPPPPKPESGMTLHEDLIPRPAPGRTATGNHKGIRKQ